jgi:hypothetical protein
MGRLANGSVASRQTLIILLDILITAPGWSWRAYLSATQPSTVETHSRDRPAYQVVVRLA